MLHGLSGNLAVWHLRMVPLLQDRFRLTTYDLRGHGYSACRRRVHHPRHGPRPARADGRAGASRDADLLGHSFGADIALHFALLFRIASAGWCSSSPVFPRCC